MSVIIITVDRIEGDYAVCQADDGIEFSLPVSLFPDNCNKLRIYDLSLTERLDVQAERTSRIRDLFCKLKNQE